MKADNANKPGGMPQPALLLQRIFISEGHRFVGRHGQAPADFPIREVTEVECVAGKGLRGDRYFDHPAKRDAQVTLFSSEILDRLRDELELPDAEAAALRRNLLVRGISDLNTLVGIDFQLQDVRFHGVEHCRPCYWMDTALGPGAEKWLQGRGGLRCRVLTSGILRVEAQR
jgi:MOSC domain-containing protein YiiM